MGLGSDNVRLDLQCNGDSKFAMCRHIKKAKKCKPVLKVARNSFIYQGVNYE